MVGAVYLELFECAVLKTMAFLEESFYTSSSRIQRILAPNSICVYAFCIHILI